MTIYRFEKEETISKEFFDDSFQFGSHYIGGASELKKSIKNMLNIALSLGAFIAGGSALSFLIKKKFPNSERSFDNIKDVDIWFPNYHALNTFLLTAKNLGFSFKSSYGGHAYDVNYNGVMTMVQIITFKVGSKEEIISDFDFANCSVAIDKDGILYDPIILECEEKNKLVLQQSNSHYFISRVLKYYSKGYVNFDEDISTKFIDTIHKMIDVSKEILRSNENISLISGYHPARALKQKFELSQNEEFQALIKSYEILLTSQSILGRILNQEEYQKINDFCKFLGKMSADSHRSIDYFVTNDARSIDYGYYRETYKKTSNKSEELLRIIT